MKKITHGITHKGIIYGWFEKELYRLPVHISNRYFCLKKLTKVPIGNQFGYRLSQKAFTINQLQELTCLLISPYYLKSNTHESTPF